MKKTSTPRKLTLRTITLKDLASLDLATVQGGLRPVTRFPACDSHNQICQ